MTQALSQPDGDGQPGRIAGRGDGRGDHDRRHHQLALGEIDDAGDVEGDGQGHPHQPVDRADGQSAEQELQQLGAPSLVAAGAVRSRGGGTPVPKGNAAQKITG